ncbi:Tannase [Dactylellina cionopaga]|nr:Tannase [Dactylellina cionopaga]
MKFSTLILTSTLLTVTFSFPATQDFQTRCSRFSTTFHPNSQTTVLVSEFISAGTNFTNPDNHPTCQRHPQTTVLADICRLRLNVTTSHTSSIVVEAWLPVDWEENGKRFLMTGNGGLGGCIAYPDISFTSSLGFAAVGHNNGHTGDIGLPFLDRPEVVKDFVYRALKIATHIGKKAITHFYKSPLSRSYYIGCSTGGRQGLKAAQDFPEEYDGIWKLVHDTVVFQCDPIDGVYDGVIEDPRLCIPRPEALLCSPGKSWESDRCLLAQQVSALSKFYQPFYGKNGKLVYPRFNPGGEITGAAFAFATGKPPVYLDWYKYAIYNDANWTVDNDFNLDAVEHADKIDPYGISTWKDLTQLKKSGGKLLTYHGLMDGLISSENSYRYYEHVSRSMSLPSAQLDEFFRFFPISGLDHCVRGSGSWYIGAPAQFETQNATGIEREGGVLMSIVRWVEDGKAPEKIVGWSVPEGWKKEYCKWPARNMWSQRGWVCR